MAAEPPVQPSSIVRFDYRQPAARRPEAGSASHSSCLRVVQWNIERGYALPSVIAELRALDADILSLQEVDVDCDRSGGLDTGRAIAQALQLNGAYLCEFLELRSACRSAALQGGGHHGQAVLTRHELLELSCLRHEHQPVDWEREGEQRGEPRRGQRVTLKAVLGCPGGVRLLLYNAHFEVFAGLLDRLHSLSDLLHDARQETLRLPRQLILADANTMAHGIARLSADYCRDRMRWRSLGWTESEWWQHFVLSVSDSSGPVNRRLLPFFPAQSPLPGRLRNPGFVEAFDVYADVTLRNHRGLYAAKLDWLLVRGLSTRRSWMGNARFTASDHRWLAADLDASMAALHEAEREAQQRNRGRVRRRCPGLLTCTVDDRLYVLQMIAMIALAAALSSLVFYARIFHR